MGYTTLGDAWLADSIAEEERVPRRAVYQERQRELREESGPRRIGVIEVLCGQLGDWNAAQPGSDAVLDLAPGLIECLGA